MKKLIILVLFFGLVPNLLLHSQAVTVTDQKQVWIGKNDILHGLVFGKGDNTPNNGLWRIDLDFNGLNFCKPWPSSSSGNCYLHLNNVWGFVGMGTCSPQSRLDVNGSIAYRNTLWTYSDINLKQNILPLKSNLSDLLSLNTIKYNRKYVTETEESARDKRIHYGFIAQELEKTFPDLVDKDADGYLRVDYIGVIPVLVNAIKELNDKVEVLESRNKELLRNTIQDITTSAVLYQNNPNPFSERTEIKYYIPTVAVNAILYVYDLNGSQILKMDIAGRENGSISINANSRGLLPAQPLFAVAVVDNATGIDGKEVDTKKMILTGE